MTEQHCWHNDTLEVVADGSPAVECRECGKVHVFKGLRQGQHWVENKPNRSGRRRYLRVVGFNLTCSGSPIVVLKPYGALYYGQQGQAAMSPARLRKMFHEVS